MQNKGVSPSLTTGGVHVTKIIPTWDMISQHVEQPTEKTNPALAGVVASHDEQGVSALTSIAKAFAVLERVVQQQSPQAGASVAELSRALSLASSTTHRLLQILKQLGYVRQNQETTRYEASMKIAALGNVVLKQYSVKERVLPLIREAAQTVGECVSFTTLQGDEGILVKRVEGTRALQVVTRNRRVPLYCTAAGKAMLACLDAGLVNSYLERTPLNPVTEYTITSPATLRAEIQQIRRLGYALDREEFGAGVRCVAVPVLIRNDNLAAISISALAPRFTKQRMEEVAACLQQIVVKHGVKLALLPES